MTTQKDGVQGLVILLAAVLCQVILGGITLSGGLFYVLYREAFDSSPVVTSWLCSLPITLWFMSTPLGSFVINTFGYRACSMVGGLIGALGVSAGFFANDILFLFFSHGIVTGIGFGMNYTGCYAAVNSYFDKYRTVATGSISIGHNLGLVLFPFLFDYLVKTYSWQGTLLILGGIIFNMVALSATFKPFQEKKTVTESTHRKPVINLSIFKKSSFICLCLSNILINFSQGIYILHLPSYAKDIGFSANDIGIVLTIYGISNVIGKVFYSFLGQHPSVDVTILYAISLTATGVCIGLSPVFLTRVGMMILPGFVGFFFCVTGALVGVVIFRIVGANRFAEGVGFAMPFKATGNLIGGPVAGFLSETSGNYTSSFVLAGVAMVSASVILVYPIIYHRRQERSLKGLKTAFVGEKIIVNNNCDSDEKCIETKVPLISEN